MRGQARAGAQPRVRVGSDFERKWTGSETLATECVLNFHLTFTMLDAKSRDFVLRNGMTSVAAFNVLTILEGAGEPLPPSVIAERMIVTRGTLTGILDSLERRGMIRRLPHSGDGRMTLVEIVPEAATRIQQLRKHLHRMERRLMSCLTQEQKRTFLAALGRMQESIEQLDL